MNEDDIMIEDDAIALEDTDDSVVFDADVSSIIPFINDRYQRSEDYRYQDEERWLRAYRNYRGLYGPDVQFTEAEKSRVFIKVTKTKTLAAYGQIVDVLFANQRFPLSVDPTELPEGVVEDVNFDPQEPEQLRGDTGLSTSPYGFAGDGQDLEPGATAQTLQEKLGVVQNKLEPVSDKLKEGPGKTPTAITFSPAMIAAKKMQKKIHDQLEESGAGKHMRNSAFEMALFGTGVMKGPFATDKEYPNWDDEGNYDPLFKTVPQVQHVSVWNFYPDPDANNMDEAQYVIERHKMSRSQLRNLKKRPYFRGQVIDEVISIGENYTKKYWEDDLSDYAPESSIERFEVLEYWGMVDVEMLEAQDISIPDELKDFDELQANVWICNNKLIRMVLNPFKPSRIPYHAAPYELNPYSFFGVGIAENMDDTQTLMNGFMRMAVDNAVLSGNLIMELDETNLVPGQDLSLYPGKVFRRQGGAPGQAIFGTKFPNVSSENMMLFDKARQLSDESTGMPSFAHGQTGVSGVGRTASGISMLMGAAQGGIKTVVKNVDDYLLRPLGEGFFRFNMQFDFDPEIKGDLEVKARGTESLMANEVRSQRLMQFLQVASSPALAPFAKFQYVIREIATSLDLDPDKVTNNMDEAALQAEIMKGFQAPAQPEQGMATGSPMDPTGAGGGNIGTGQVPVPGEQGFSANGQEANTQQPQAAGGQQPPMGGIQ
ncbi:head-tail adaptor [Puniceispirillum phage HMO-2011]|uniref:head-tail adaptor n=1 Tax=Puniceispirillum phage HMO-2011 TaxID=948071 RepID=UPI000351FAA1|nr:head-tail adaptor [Puniceispirillum phage HMO-2011]ADW08442.1 putative portal protein [Puniceispirillum phage HMO-2011]